MRLPGIEIDEKVVVSSTGALSLAAVPKHFVVVGGGYIGLELGSVWRRLGAEVTVIEFLDRITPTMDGETRQASCSGCSAARASISSSRPRWSERRGTEAGVTLTLEPAAGGPQETLDADVVMVCIGRRPYTDGLGLAEVGVELDERQRVKVDHNFATNVPGIYAIGDVIAGPMLAHKAEEEGVVLAELLAGQKPHVNYDAIPAVIYTHPEVASVGKTEEELKAGGDQLQIRQVPVPGQQPRPHQRRHGRFVKILADATTDRVLGVHIIGSDAGTMIAEAVLGIEFGASSEDIGRTCHAHPTLSEAVKEAALAVTGAPLNL